jgi:hypothetical protein
MPSPAAGGSKQSSSPSKPVFRLQPCEVCPVPPADEPPLDTPPLDVPPLDAPPVDAPPLDAPPLDAPPLDAPPLDAPPLDEPPFEEPAEPAVEVPPFDEASSEEPHAKSVELSANTNSETCFICMPRSRKTLFSPCNRARAYHAATSQLRSSSASRIGTHANTVNARNDQRGGDTCNPIAHGHFVFMARKVKVRGELRRCRQLPMRIARRSKLAATLDQSRTATTRKPM